MIAYLSTFYRHCVVWSTYGGCVYFIVNIYMWCEHDLEGIVLWISGGDDHTMWIICLVTYSSYDLGCVANVMSM